MCLRYEYRFYISRMTRHCNSLSMYKYVYISCFTVFYTTEEIEDVAETADQLALSAAHIYLVDSGLVFNSPFPPLLRLERDVDIFLSFDFSIRKRDLEFPFKVNQSIDMIISTKLLTSWSSPASRYLSSFVPAMFCLGTLVSRRMGQREQLQISTH